jgi:RHS repeat-associated protein
LPFGESMAEQRSYTGSFDNRWKFNGKELDEETGLYYYGARFDNPSTSLWLSVDPLVEKTMDAYGYCYQNPVRFIDPDGLSAIVGDDTFIFTDKDKKVQTKVVNTGDNTPNRLFVQDPEANSETPNRLESDGMYFEQKMIPSSEYSEEDYEVKMSLGFNSQFDKDRFDYIWQSGEYSDNNALERLGESLSDDSVTIDDLMVLVTRRNSKKENTSSNIDFRKKKKKDYDSDESEHRKMTPSKKEKHEKGQERKTKDKGGEKGDKRRPYRRK